jgi:hypothetical protein
MHINSPDANGHDDREPGRIEPDFPIALIGYKLKEGK